MLASNNKEILNTYYVPGTVLGTEDIIMSQAIRKNSLPSWANSEHNQTKLQMGTCL